MKSISSNNGIEVIKAFVISIFNRVSSSIIGGGIVVVVVVVVVVVGGIVVVVVVVVVVVGINILHFIQIGTRHIASMSD